MLDLINPNVPAMDISAGSTSKKNIFNRPHPGQVRSDLFGFISPVVEFHKGYNTDFKRVVLVNFEMAYDDLVPFETVDKYIGIEKIHFITLAKTCWRCDVLS